MPESAEKQSKSSFITCRVRLTILCLVGHIADKGVTWRRVKVGEGEGKLPENCGKEVKKRREEGQG